jgi:hypothetical protein
MSSYHAKVAKAMAESILVGRDHTYEEILSALLRVHPTEEGLRRHVAEVEAEMHAELGPVFDGCHLIAPEDDVH